MMDDNYWRKESDEEREGARERANDLPLPDDLPPVEPPSAGLIVQLFLVPAIIVGVIVGFYALFGKMASRELDWRQLTVDVRSENPHIRWRGALGLAQMLDANAHRSSTSQDVTANPEIAAALSELYARLISLPNPSDEEVKQIEFLSKALGRMQVADIVRPALEAGITPGLDRDVRKHSLIGLAMLAGTLRDHGKVLDDPTLIDELIEISREQEPLFRHQAAYVLGLIPTPSSLDRLEVLLEDPDQMVRVNAAIGFARNSKTTGVPVFHELLREAAAWKLDPSTVATPEEEASYFEKTLMVLNAIKAISQLKPDLSEKDRTGFAEQLNAVSKSTQDAVLRTDALKAMHDLKST
jgi:hypothetical protein